MNITKRKSYRFLVSILCLILIACFSVACDSDVEQPAHEHKFSEEWVKDETHHYHACSCGDKQDYEEHNYDNGEITLEPTKTENGEKVFTCTICSTTKIVEIPALGEDPDNPDTPDIPDTPDNPDTPDTPDTPDGPDNPDNPDNPEDPDQPDKYFIEFISNGQSDYFIVVKNGYLRESDKILKTAAEELQRVVKLSSGVTLPIVEDDTFIENYLGSKYVSIGNTALVPDTVETQISSLEDDGIMCYSEGDNIYLLGGTKTAVVYSSYEFLERYFGYDAISTGVEVYNINVADVKIEEFNFVETPDILQRHLDGTHGETMTYKYRMHSGSRGYYAASGLFTEENGKPTETYILRNQHNTLDYIPYNTHKAQHGKYWYATDASGNLLTTSSGQPGEVCFTAHGNESEYELMINEYAEMIKKTIIQRFVIAEYQKTGELWWKNSTWTNMSIGIEDNGIVCKCNSCIEKEALYGGYRSGLVIKFVKDVSDKIYDWFETSEGANYVIENFRISFSAYANYVDAPVKYDDQKGKYVAVHKDVEFNDRIMVGLALSSTYKYTSLLDIDDPRNAEGKQNILKWFDLTSNATLWTYNGNFGDYLHFTDSFAFESNNTYKFFDEHDVISWHNQNIYNCYPISGFTGLKTYLNSKLMWDTDSDVNYYIDKYFSGMYGEYSSLMRSIFDKQRDMFKDAYSKFIEAGDSWNGYSYYDSRTDLSGYYDDSELNLLISAYNVILNKLDKNSDMYYRVLTEALSPYYTLLTNAPIRVAKNVTNTSYPVIDDYILSIKDKFRQMISEHNAYYSDLYGDKGIMLVCETGVNQMEDMFWSELGYRHSVNGARAWSLLIPRINYEVLKDSGRVNNATKKLTIGNYELDWVFGIHSTPFQYFDYQNIKFEVISGEDVLLVVPNDFVLDNGGVVPSSLIYDAKIKDIAGNNYTYFNPALNKDLNVKRFDYGTLVAQKSGTAVLRLSYNLDGRSYKFDITMTVSE